MPRNPNFQTLAADRNSLLEFTMYFDYESAHRHTKFEARIRMTIGQLAEFGGMYKLQRVTDDILYDVCGIQSEAFDKSTLGFRFVEGQRSQFGTYKIHDVYGGHVYLKGDKWGSMEYVWR
jgi:hypothetical protein